MVAESIALPNVRKMIIPDPGYEIVESDLSKADVCIVAAEARDENLLSLLMSGLDLHKENAKDIFGVQKPTHEQYQKAKVGCHACNYDVKAKKLAFELGCTIHEADTFIRRWFESHPQIKEWHRRVQSEISTTRSVTNPFGFRMYFFDRMDGLLPKALAWVPQSTVAIVTYKAMFQLEETVPEAEQLLQVHDSIVMQIPKELCPAIFEKVRSAMMIEIPYENPLIIPATVAHSDKSWGDCEKYKFAA